MQIEKMASIAAKDSTLFQVFAKIAEKIISNKKICKKFFVKKKKKKNCKKKKKLKVRNLS